MNTISCNKKEFVGRIELPSSKSIANRLLIISALSGNNIKINNLIHSDDTLLMQSCLHDFRSKKIIDAHNAGTVYRFLTAFLALQKGEWELTGSPRMMQRPIGPLVDALRYLGAEITYLGKEGYPPLSIKGGSLIGGRVEIDAASSSQYISALLLIAPLLEHGLEIAMTGTISSEPYINITIQLMQQCGVEVKRNGQIITVKQGNYKAKEIDIEADWSSAAFFFELAALSDKSSITIPGLFEKSFQGDSVLPLIYSKLGVHSEIKNGELVVTKGKIERSSFSYDFKDTPDLFLPLAITCAGLGIEFNGTGLKNLRIKESDRLEAIRQGLCALGWDATILEPDAFSITSYIPHKIPDDVIISSFGDHRIAMAFAILAVITGKISIDDMSVVSKSFPAFSEQMKQLGFIIT